MQLYGTQFGNKHTLNDWGMYIVNRQDIKPPEPKKIMIDIPGGNGSLDLTEALSGEVVYENREIECEFYVIGGETLWAAKYSEILAYIHGKRMKITFDDDPAYYYMGRVSVNQWKSSRQHSIITIDIDADPFKYELNPYGEDWLWDPFDFLYGEIYDSTVEVSGTLVQPLTVKQMPVIPTFTSNVAMKVTYQGSTYDLPANKETKVYDIRLTEGTQNITFTGNGSVKISFTNGVL